MDAWRISIRSVEYAGTEGRFHTYVSCTYANNTTATMMGGWELSIPTTTTNKELAWELITLMLNPGILTPMLLENGYLPTQIPIGDGPFSANISKYIPYFEEMVSMVPLGHKRPNVPEYPLVTENIGQAINQIYNGSKQPNEALQHASRNFGR